MRRQQQIWFDEYTKIASIPAMNSQEPASGVTMFIDYIRQLGATIGGKAVDIGAGKGRNAVYLAEQGYQVSALEYVTPAIEAGTALAATHKVQAKVQYLNTAIDKAWPFADNYFDIAIDSFSSIDIETKQGRNTYLNELWRTLKPGGYGMVMVVSVDDEWEVELIKNHPGKESNSTYWPNNGKFQKDYSEAELRQFYSQFTCLECRKVSRETEKLGRKGIATNYWLVVRKS